MAWLAVSGTKVRSNKTANGGGKGLHLSEGPSQRNGLALDDGGGMELSEGGQVSRVQDGVCALAGDQQATYGPPLIQRLLR